MMDNISDSNSKLTGLLLATATFLLWEYVKIDQSHSVSVCARRFFSEKMCGLGPGIALGSTRVYLSLWRDPRFSSLYFPGATFPVCPGLPNEPLRQRTR